MWVRGNKRDYDRWEEEEGAKGWSWEKVLPTFNSLENFERGNPKLRGKSGAIHPRETGSKISYFVDTVESMEKSGVAKKVEDYNDGNQFGCGFTQESVLKDGTRADAFSAFIEPLLKDEKFKGKLRVVSEAKVHRVHFNSKKQVSGVKVRVDGGFKFLSANKEVILSAGALISPQILMLSGIGDSKELEKFGIEVVHDNKHVGKNMHDHPLVRVIFESNRRVPSGTEMGGSLLAHAFYQSTVSKRDTPNDGPDMQLVACTNFPPLALIYALTLNMIKGWMGNKYPRARTLMGNLKNNLSRFFEFLARNHSPTWDTFSKAAGFGICSNQPFSRGHLTISTDNIDDQPLMEMNVLKDQRDVDKLVEAVETCYKVIETAPLSNYFVKWIAPPKKLDKKEDIEKYVRGEVALAW